jgi:hypothetical protein
MLFHQPDQECRNRCPATLSAGTLEGNTIEQFPNFGGEVDASSFVGPYGIGLCDGLRNCFHSVVQSTLLELAIANSHPWPVGTAGTWEQWE